MILADGPWTEARLLSASPRLVAARKWIEFVRALAPSATQDLDTIKEQVEDDARDLSTKSQSAREGLARSRISRARARLMTAYQQRAKVRELLLLDEDSDGEP